ncbi:MAG: tyrosine-type recombinase/integrase [Phycisphaerales bacterium]
MERRERSKGTGSLFQRTDGGPWVGAFMDCNGKRVVRSTKTTDKASAGRILAKWVADAALRREGVIDPALDHFAVEGRKDLEAHIEAYINQCERLGLAADHVAAKRRHLRRLRDVTGISRLNELTPDALERYLAAAKKTGKSPRSINFARQQVLAFAAWCVETRRLAANTLVVVRKQDESNGRRRVRRPLTDAELEGLLRVAASKGRAAWYLGAALAGLRRGDLKRLLWSDVNFRDATITIRGGKAKRVDVIPMHPQLAAELEALRGRSLALPTAKVFPQAVTNVTRVKDFLRAGIYRREAVVDAHGHPEMIGKGKRRRARTRLVITDADGRVADLHALRTTLGTNLARAGVAPQIAQKIMRHSDYRTTLAHYTVLGLADTAQAIGRIVVPTGRALATGTTGP